MKFKVFGLVLSLVLPLIIISCEKENSSSEERNFEQLVQKKKPRNGKGKNNGSSADDSGSITYTATFQLDQAVDSDPLFRFSISQAGDQMLLESDPTLASWGTDFWGYWSDPFNFTNNQVSYTTGLSTTSYHFSYLGNGDYDVTKTVVTQPYLGGKTTTTNTHPGVYSLAP